MRKTVILSCIALQIFLSGGCLSYMEQAKNEEAKREYRITSAQVEVDALKERVRMLESSLEKLSSEQAVLKQQTQYSVTS